MRSRSPFIRFGRWLSAAVVITLLALLTAASARALPSWLAGTPADPHTLGPSTADGPPTDPNAKDPDYGKPSGPLPKNPKGWGDNGDLEKAKSFPHYGKVSFKLCDLPYDKAKGGEFNKWSANDQRSWCRKQLDDKFGMDADYTNHELLEGNGANKVLTVYKVWKDDHKSSGRPLLYHPRQLKDPDDPTKGVQPKAYEGGIAQLKREPDHAFKKAKPPTKKKTSTTSVTTTPTVPVPALLPVPVPLPEPAPEPEPEPDVDTCVDGETCEICLPCATSPEDAAAWCGEGEGACP